jgi:protease-4
MILLRLVGLLFDLLLWPLRLLRRSRAIPKGAFVTIEIDGPVADVVAKPRFWEVRQQKASSIWEVSRIVDVLVRDPRVRGVLVTIKDLGAGFAAATSLRAQLARVRAAGKEVVVSLPMGGGTKEVYVASVATKLVLGPATQLSPVGFYSSSRYVRRALDRAGIEPEVFHCGEYKSAGENFVRDAMSAQQREQMDKLLSTFHDTLLDAIAEGRGIDRDKAREIVDRAPYFGEHAVAAGLADAACYEDEIAAALGIEKKSKRGSVSRFFVDGDAYFALRTRPLFRPLLRMPFVAVIPVHGTIAHASGLFGSLATDERVTRMIRVARLDPRVLGVILHVDSPGGSALASDRMHHEIVQLAREKPVVACMANVAASGGYYVAAPAHRVVCEATTITGSIGVVAARLSIAPLLSRLGIVTESLRKGARAGLLSAGQPLNDDERGALSRELDATYRAFVGVVARGRKMSEDDLEPLARGRVYTGKDALSVGLVDALGGFGQAMTEIRKLLPPPARVLRDRIEPRVIRLPRRSLPTLDPPTEGEAGRRAAHALLGALLAPLPRGERALIELATAGERVVALFTGFIG